MIAYLLYKAARWWVSVRPTRTVSAAPVGGLPAQARDDDELRALGLIPY